MEYECGEFVDTGIDDWNDYLSIGGLTELDAADYTIHNEPIDARVFRLDEDNLFIAYAEEVDPSDLGSFNGVKKTEHDHQQDDARRVLWQEIQDGEANVLPGGQLEKELELEFGAFTHPDDDEPPRRRFLLGFLRFHFFLLFALVEQVGLQLRLEGRVRVDELEIGP